MTLGIIEEIAPPWGLGDDPPHTDADAPPDLPPRRPEIILGPDIDRVANEAIAALAAHGVYQRQGTLVDVVRHAVDRDGLFVPEGTARIRIMPGARLREMLATAIDFKRKKKDEDGKFKLASVSPPVELSSIIMARGEWAHIRPLAGIAEWPVMRPDGSLLSTPGYDHGTTLIYEPSIEVELPEEPTLEDAQRGLDTLHGLLSDFPFATGAHRSAWLAMLLTLLARPAIAGPVPLTLIDANARGVGKSLLADVAGMICRGKELPRRTAPEDPAEWKKALLGIAIAADPIVLIDNVTKTLKSDALDAILTGGEFSERVLGKNEELSLIVRTVFVATANNAMLSSDLIRRSLHIRLETQSERPERRTGFANDPLLPHVHEHRARYLAAALTVLRAFVVAGRPEQKLIPMGSYEAWSKVVRAALVWAGEPDPGESQEGLREASDPELETVRSLLTAWNAVHGERAVTVRSVLSDLDVPPKDEHGLSPAQSDLRDAINVFCDADPGKLPSLRKLGNRLRGLRGRVIGELVFERVDDHTRDGTTWRSRKLFESQQSQSVTLVDNNGHNHGQSHAQSQPELF
jgi:putative DNA primase/helicase